MLSNKGSLLHMLGDPLRMMVPLVVFSKSPVYHSQLARRPCQDSISVWQPVSSLNFWPIQETLIIISQAGEKFLSLLYAALFCFLVYLCLFSFKSFPHDPFQKCFRHPPKCVCVCVCLKIFRKISWPLIINLSN